ncbi:DUF3050 domain-containing protein [Synechococcus sp. RedBA-s]|nr:DUF3050 domain-containing protein [Synechococcus sp. RedBA-s]MCP9800133.1 DUF3050 domain-containing protein [Synechococcus sp. RedBA-s]
MLSTLCGRSPSRLQAVQSMADRAVAARREFWDGIHRALVMAP